jgi:hypothetical protein
VPRGAAILAASILALLVTGQARAGQTDADAALADRGLAAAAASGRITAPAAATYRASVADAVSVLARLGNPRAANLGAVLHEVASQSASLSAPRALALYSMLAVNASYLGTHAVPVATTDIAGPDKVIYRYFSGRGFQFHPLGNFGALNADLAAGHLDDARTLAAALVARGVPRAGGLIWEYYFPFGGGAAPWTSGMAQAVAAQAFARASAALSDPSFLDEARKAYAAIPSRLVRPLDAGPWIRLYSFSSSVVLNAQLQAAISVRDYATIAADSAAAALAAGLESSSAAMLARFDTGWWSLYSLAGDESPLTYHQYVISLLQKLAARSSDPRFAAEAQRFQTDLGQPPAFELGRPAGPLYGKRSLAAVSFWLSKISTVTLRVGGGRRTLRLGFGWHTLSWQPPSAAPALYPVSLSAVDLTGRTASVDLLPLAVLKAAS